jgi:multiple sugar transport system permease protein
MAMTAPVQTIHRPGYRWRKVLPNYLFLVPYLIFFLCFRVGPDLFGFFVSFHNWEILAERKPFIGLANYQELLRDDLWWISLRNTILFAILTVVGNTVVGLTMALLVKQRIPGQHLFRVLFYTPVILSVAVMGTVLQRAFNTEYGLINFYLNWLGLPSVPWLADARIVIPALAGATVWWTFGFPMLVFLAGLLNIPEHLYEAARIDGANAVQAFFAITLPLLRPVLLFVIVTQFIAHLQVFGQMYIMTGGGPGYASYSVILYLYDNGWRFYRMGYAAAMAFSLAAIIFVITLINFRLFGQRVEY